MTTVFTDALRQLRPCGSGHDLALTAVDLALMPTDDSEAIAGLAPPRNQAEVFGLVASNPNSWRLLADVDPATLSALRSPRATAREIAWLHGDENPDMPASRAGGNECRAWSWTLTPPWSPSTPRRSTRH